MLGTCSLGFDTFCLSQSMMLLRQDLMIHIDQLRNKVDMVSGLGGTANMAEGTSLTFVRMDEEERATLQKAIEQHGREISRIDSCKADANLVHGILSEKADHDALETKVSLQSARRQQSSL